ncbi:MAG: phage terminase large subunit family protein, partial [Chloroflexota bacterium]
MSLLVEQEAAPAFLDSLEAILALKARRQRASVEAADRAAAAPVADLPRSPLAWAERYRQIEGVPFSLERFRPLRALYEDTHPRICVLKPAQRGVSEWAITYAGLALEQGARLWAPPEVPKDGLNVAYIFPTRDALQDFSKERFTALEDETPHLRALFGAPGEYDDVTFKQVGRSYLYLRGGWSESALLSFPADVLILDEYDRLDHKAVALARRRLNASVVRREVA